MPQSCFGRGKAQALEGNRHPYDESAVGHFAARIPYGVERSIEVTLGLLLAGGLGPDSVPLHAEGRGLKGVGAAAVVKGIEHDLDLVVVVNVFSARHAGAHLFRIIEANEDHVEIFLVVAEISVGGLGYSFAVVRIALCEARDFRHLLRDFALRLHAEEVFQRRRSWSAEESSRRGARWRRHLRVLRTHHRPATATSHSRRHNDQTHLQRKAETPL